MSESHARRVAVEARAAACAITAAGDVFPTLLWQHRQFAQVVLRVADLADQADGEERQQLTGELLSLFYVLNEALVNHYAAAAERHAQRLGIGVHQLDDRLYPPPPGDDEQGRRAWQHSISGAADRLRAAGLIGLGQERGHVLHEIIRVVWVTAERRADIDAFLNRLDEVRQELVRAPVQQ
ncbi:hypothetical protein [Nonomuraea sp. NPDC049758]|uniref:hypothetical protein n=1 Tax=Nonomuraea sp. NPDC049758 TaxID=3154360 RepID=UPI00343B8C04